MKRFSLTVFVCLMFAMNSAIAAILKDAEGFSYMNNYNYLIYSAGSKVISAYDLTSIHVLANNDSRFEFNVLGLSFSNGKDVRQHISNFREDYGTGKIYVNGNVMGNTSQWGKTFKEIYYKMKSIALSK